MTSKSSQTGFSRKVVAYYLFFCMLAVTWLSLGVLTTSQKLLSSRTTSNCLSKLGQLASAVEMDILRHDGQGIQTLVEQASADGRLAYCSIVAADGRFLAHTTRPLIGAPATEPTGARLRWGNVEGIRYNDDLHGMLSEYRVPLSVWKENRASLRLGVVEPDFLGVLLEVANASPLTILLPLGCVILGAFLLRRTVSPLAMVEKRLKEIAATPHNEPLTVQPVPNQGGIATGWNRLATMLSRSLGDESACTLKDRVAEALATRRQSQSLDVLQSLRDGIAVTNAEGRIEFANAAIASLLDTGIDAESLGNLTELTLLEALDAATNSAEAFPDAATMKPVVAELKAHSDGEPRTLRVERQPIDAPTGGAGGDGAVGKAVWSIRDVTQQKLAEKSRDQFIDAATHELRTPLANIKAYAETLSTCELDDPEQQKEFYNTINTEATRLARFVDDLLDISSMEVGSLLIRRQNVEIERLFREAVDKVRPLLEKKSITFEVVMPPKLGEMQIDKDKVSALLVNLLGNAAKYTPEGGQVRFKVESGENNLLISIADTGYGIAEDELPKVFEKFFRSDNPAVRDEVGTGLGLPLAREIARLHGGDITAESTLGEGSTFTISLPRASESSTATGGPA